MRPLNARQQAFVAAKLAGLSNTKAARAAGYTCTYGDRLARHPVIEAELWLWAAATVTVAALAQMEPATNA